MSNGGILRDRDNGIEASSEGIPLRDVEVLYVDRVCSEPRSIDDKYVGSSRDGIDTLLLVDSDQDVNLGSGFSGLDRCQIRAIGVGGDSIDLAEGSDSPANSSTSFRTTDGGLGPDQTGGEIGNKRTGSD